MDGGPTATTPAAGGHEEIVMSATHEIDGRRKAGLVLGIVVGLSNIPAVFTPGAGEAEFTEGPPIEVTVFGFVAGVAIAGLLALAWRRRSRALVRVAAVLLVLTALSAVPAFFVPDIPSWVVAGAGVYVLATIVTLVLLFAPERRSSAVGATA